MAAEKRRRGSAQALMMEAIEGGEGGGEGFVGTLDMVVVVIQNSNSDERE